MYLALWLILNNYKFDYQSLPLKGPQPPPNTDLQGTKSLQMHLWGHSNWSWAIEIRELWAEGYKNYKRT
jgi:hypothetical protein